MNADDPADVFADLQLSVLQSQAAAGLPASGAEMEALRERVQNRAPACWHWPAPATCTFTDEENARDFLRWWNQGCAICGCAGELVEDHDHRTAMTRGFLCRGCNIAEGASDRGTFRKYRERNPASILGISVRYWSAWTGEARPEPDRTDADRAAIRAAVDNLSLPGPDELAATS